MKKQKQFVIALLTISFIAQAQVTIPNASFENWTTGTFFNPDIPVGWQASSISSGAGKTTDAHTGTYALKLKIKPSSSVPDISAGFTFPIANAPTYFSYWAKVHLNGSDKFFINADIYNKTTSFNPASIPYSEEYTYPSQNTNTWTLFTYTLQGNFTSPSDSVNLRFTFTTGVDTASYVIIDDLAFSNTPLGINTLNNELLEVSIFPNPANSVLNIELLVFNNETTTIEMANALGQIVLSETLHTKNSTLKTNNLISGIYFLTLTNKGKTVTRKIIIG